LPAVHEINENGAKTLVDRDALFAFERNVRDAFVVNRSLDEVFLLAESPSEEMHFLRASNFDKPRRLIELEVYGDRGILRLTTGYGEKRIERAIGSHEIAAVRRFIAHNDVDKLPKLEWPRIVDGKETMVVHGTVYVYFHQTRRTARRLWMSNPPIEGQDDYPPHEDEWEYAKVVDFFNDLAREARGE
jgi:hypothetical protein